MTHNKKEDVMILLLIAFSVAAGAFLLICGLFRMHISEIGVIPSVGYVLGMCGVLFSIMLLLEITREK